MGRGPHGDGVRRRCPARRITRLRSRTAAPRPAAARATRSAGGDGCTSQARFRDHPRTLRGGGRACGTRARALAKEFWPGELTACCRHPKDTDVIRLRGDLAMTALDEPQEAHDAQPLQEAAAGPTIVAAPPRRQSGEPMPPRRPTQARLQTYFLRAFALSGSLSEAAARTGVAPRTVRRWRAVNSMFDRRYEAVLAERVELLEDLAMRRARAVEHRPVISRGMPGATIERHNDVMVMRVLARFDRLRERQGADPKELTPEDLKQMSSLELAKLSGLPIPPNTSPREALVAAVRYLVEVMQSRLPKESAFSGQGITVGGGKKGLQNNELSGSP